MKQLFLLLAILAIILCSSAALFAQQDTDFALLGPDLAAAQNKMAGEWNLAFCGKAPESAARYTLSLTDSLVAADSVKRLTSIHNVGLSSETTSDTSAEPAFKLTRGDRYPDGHGGEIDLLTFEQPLTVAGEQRVAHLEIYATPKGRIMGSYFEQNPDSEPPAPLDRTLVFGRRGTRDSLHKFAATARDLCGQVHAGAPVNVTPVESWVGFKQ